MSKLHAYEFYRNLTIQIVNAVSPKLLPNEKAVICCAESMGDAKLIGANNTAACNTPSAMQAYEYALADCV